MVARHARRRAAAALLLAALGAGTAAVPALAGSPAPSSPTPSQIGAAVARVKRAHSLWATVNTCDTRANPHTIGIRAQMPALGFPARLSMRIRVDYWDPGTRAWLPVPGPSAGHLVRLGVVSAGDEQGGFSFSFPRHTGRLSGTVVFAWRRSGKLLLSLTRATTAGHPDADGGDPPHHSAASCVIR